MFQGNPIQLDFKYLFKYYGRIHYKLMEIIIFYKSKFININKAINIIFYIYLLAHKCLLLVSYKIIIYFLLPRIRFIHLIVIINLMVYFF